MEELKVRLTILFFLISAVLCLLVSMNTDNWTEHQGVFSGLWRKCKKLNGETSCEELSNNSLPGFFTYVRALCAIALGFFIAGILYCIFVIFRPRTFGLTCFTVFVIIGGLSLLIGLSIYTYFNDDKFSNSIRFHWSYFVGWLGVFMALLTTIISCYDITYPSSPYGQAYRIE
ncbi:claudin domain-containing protein 2 [Hydra vulgaris]|uniref:claudin domain-containing protein 2 n=1 Tax=Hydra vulgaris TaxID=6087 RepID=UPI0001925F5C|nr:claudin domain-containing protein 2-like [Hydra vulgaris]